MRDYKDNDMGHGTVYGASTKTPNMGKGKAMTGKKSTKMGKSSNMGKSMGKDCK